MKKLLMIAVALMSAMMFHAHGFDSIAAVDLMDEYGQMRIPVKDKKHIKYDIVGDHLANYDFMINLAHFKGHAMGGFGGVLKNQSIGVASTDGKAYIHTAGKGRMLLSSGQTCLSRMISWRAWRLRRKAFTNTSIMVRTLFILM